VEEGGEPGDAHPAREVAGVKAAWWWMGEKVSGMQFFGFFSAKMTEICIELTLLRA
jgi:hypothetical protein